MKSIGLRLFLTPDVLANLVSAVAGKFKNFVRIKNTRHAGDVYEVDLSILDSYHTGTIDMVTPVNQVTVTREMFGEVCDVIGIFPCAKKVFGVKELVDGIEYRARVIVDIREKEKKGKDRAPDPENICFNADVVLQLCGMLRQELGLSDLV